MDLEERLAVSEKLLVALDSKLLLHLLHVIYFLLVALARAQARLLLLHLGYHFATFSLNSFRCLS